MDLDEAPSGELPILYEKHFSQPIKASLSDFCNPHDLIAVAPTAAQRVDVYRLNGHLAFSVDREDSNDEVTEVKWKPDGSVLSIGWSNGKCGVYSGEDGKSLSLVSILEQQDAADLTIRGGPGNGVGQGASPEGSAVCCVGWTTYYSQSQKPVRFLDANVEHLDTEQWYDESDSEAELDAYAGERIPSQSGITDLTRAIAAIDVTKSLPLLNALPIHALRFHPQEQKFATQAGMDSLLNTSHLSSTGITTKVAISTSGLMGVFLDDSIKIGNFDLGGRSASILHSSHPECTSQVILSTTEDGTQQHLHHIDLPLETLSGALLQVVALNTKRMQTLVGYIDLTVRCIQSDFTSNLQLPSRLMSNITEELSEKQEGDLVTNLYELAMTGNYTPTMLEWLADTVKESTHKRWDKNVNDMYHHIQNHIFMNLTQALNRLAIATNSIRGHALFHEGSDRFVSSQPFTNLMNDIDSMRILAQRLQLIVMTEQRQFRAFSKWLRVMIDIGVAGPGSKAANEIEERELPGLDYNLLLAYIKETLMRSRLSPHLEPPPVHEISMLNGQSMQVPHTTELSHDNIVAALNLLEKDEKMDEKEIKSLLNLSAVNARLIESTSAAIASITTWQNRTLLKPSKIALKTAFGLSPNTRILDLTLSPPPSNRSDVESITSILAAPSADEWDDEIAIYRVSRLHTKECEFQNESYALPAGELLDAKMLSEEQCLVLLKQSDSGSCSLVSRWLPVEPDSYFQTIKVLHSFPRDGGFIPENFIVGGRRGKMVCVVFGNDGHGWKVLDLSGDTPMMTTEEDEVML